MSCHCNNCAQFCDPCQRTGVIVCPPCPMPCPTPCPMPCPTPCPMPCPTPCPMPYPPCPMPYPPCPTPYPPCPTPCPMPCPTPCVPLCPIQCTIPCNIPCPKSCSKPYRKSSNKHYKRNLGKNSCKCGNKHCGGGCKQYKQPKQCNKCYRCDCNCVEFFPCLDTKCGTVSATMAKTSNPTYYTAVGDVITYSYTVTNTGSAIICFPIEICDDKLGGQIIPCTYIPPCLSQKFTRTYTITPADLLVSSITNTAAAYIKVCDNKWVCTPAVSATITYGSADVSGTLSQAVTAVTGGTGGTVSATISNSASSTTAAFGVSLFLPFPAGVTSGITVPGAAIGAASVPVVSVTGVTITEVSIPIGTTYQYEFTYGPVAAGAYQFAGTITTASLDPDTTNNGVTNTLVIP